MAEQLTRAQVPGAGPGRFAGISALVTSATDPVGQHVAAHLHGEGACVGILDPNGRRARVVAETLGRGAIPLVGDAGRPDDMDGAIHRCRHAFGHLDVVVHVLPGDDDGYGTTAAAPADAP